MAELTAERLREIVHYCPETGVFTWLIARRGNPKGSIAGTVHRPKKSSTFYVLIGVDGRCYKAHRLAFLYMTGSWPLHHVDHKNPDGIDNRWSNLRDATPSQNQANRGAQSNSWTGIKGVSYCKRDDLYHAEIRFEGRRFSLGYFKNPRVAALIYERAAKRLHGEFARVA
jgi:hypothetical protein